MDALLGADFCLHAVPVQVIQNLILDDYHSVLALKHMIFPPTINLMSLSFILFVYSLNQILLMHYRIATYENLGHFLYISLKQVS